TGMGGMSARHHTIIIVPHSRARFRKLRVTSRVLWTLGISLSFLFILSIFTTWSLITTRINRAELAKLQTENEQLRSVNGTFESSLHKLQGQLNQSEERTRKLAIVAGLDNLAGNAEAGIGGESTSAENRQDLLLDLEERAATLSSDIDQVQKGFDQQLRKISSTPSIAPVKGILTSHFGDRVDPFTGHEAFHDAIDIAAPVGRPIHATADGLVTHAGPSGGLGRAVFLAHGFGITTRYGHMSRIIVHPGERVKRGQVIGYVGSTGRSTGYHVHYEVRLDGHPVNPLPYILSGPTSGS
ncbi:MAG TPA: peptidoglycan DD-metalloendopeptidase family protein, partial [Thermoanaerobaculia bacterium]|nr:peptidoglycan DD-metalloendopeptidase family protein [Thermoanaerobaculia bacterium]